MMALIWFVCIWLALALAIFAFILCAHYCAKLAKIRERMEARRMHKELDELEMRDVLDSGCWR